MNELIMEKKKTSILIIILFTLCLFYSGCLTFIVLKNNMPINNKENSNDKTEEKDDKKEPEEKPNIYSETDYIRKTEVNLEEKSCKNTLIKANIENGNIIISDETKEIILID